MFWRIDFQLLRIFRSVMHHRQLTSAAEEIGVTQSALSHSLRRLSHLLGQPLFQRSSKGMLPTPFAETIAPRIEAVLGAAEEAFGVKADYAPSAQTVFRVGIVGETASIYAGSLAPILEGNKARLEIASLPPTQVLPALLERKVDMAFLTGALDEPRIERQMVMATPWVVAARKDNPAFARKKDMSLKKYLSCRHIALTLGEMDMASFGFASSGLERDVAVAASSALTALSVASESDFLATLPQALAKPYAKSQDLRLMPCPVELPPYALYSYWLGARATDPHVMLLKEAISKTA